MVARNTLEYLKESDWVLILARANRLTFEPGKEIIQEGSRGRAVYIIRKGSVSIELTIREQKAEIALLGPGEIFGEISFLTKGTTSAAVVAKDKVEVDELDDEELQLLFESFPGIGARFYHSLAVVLAMRLRETSSTLAGAKNLNN